MAHHLENIFVSREHSLKEVLAVMAANKKDSSIPPGIALVVEKDKKLCGIITNGDIRRAFAAGRAVTDPVSRVMNPAPSVIVRPDGGEILPRVIAEIKSGRWPKDRLEKIIITDSKGRVLDLVSFYDLVQKSDTRFKHIGVVGLGYVGLTLGITLADLGFMVKGDETNKGVAEAIRRGKPHFYEAGLDRLLSDHLGKNFVVASDFSKENNCDVYFIAVGTPLDDNHIPNLGHLEAAARSVGAVLKYGDAVVLRSTVPLGTTRDIVLPLLEKESGLTAGEGFLLAFAPERTIEGRALEELRVLPQVIGGINHASSDLVASIFNVLSHSTVIVESLEAAEMVKLVNNTYRDVSFGFANEVSLVAHAWGIDAKEVIDAANYGYERSRVPSPSPGVGGYCLEKDPYIFIESARKRGYELRMPADARAVSALMIARVAATITDFLQDTKKGKNAKIAILGFAFKGRPVTSDMRGSTTLGVLEHIRAAGFKNISGFDPAVRPEDIKATGVKLTRSAVDAFRTADAVLVMTDHPDFQALPVRDLLATTKKPSLLFDTWSLYHSDEVKKVKEVTYKRL